MERAKARLGVREVGGAVGGDVPGGPRQHGWPCRPERESWLGRPRSGGSLKQRFVARMDYCRRVETRRANERRALDRGSVSNSDGDHESS